MRNLEVYGRQCIEDLNAIGIYPNNVSEFKVNTRAKKRWGAGLQEKRCVFNQYQCIVITR